MFVRLHVIGIALFTPLADGRVWRRPRGQAEGERGGEQPCPPQRPEPSKVGALAKELPTETLFLSLQYWIVII